MYTLVGNSKMIKRETKFFEINLRFSSESLFIMYKLSMSKGTNSIFLVENFQNLNLGYFKIVFFTCVFYYASQKLFVV